MTTSIENSNSSNLYIPTTTGSSISSWMSTTTENFVKTEDFNDRINYCLNCIKEIQYTLNKDKYDKSLEISEFEDLIKSYIKKELEIKGASCKFQITNEDSKELLVIYKN